MTQPDKLFSDECRGAFEEWLNSYKSKARQWGWSSNDMYMAWQASRTQRNKQSDDFLNEEHDNYNDCLEVIQPEQSDNILSGTLPPCNSESDKLALATTKQSETHLLTVGDSIRLASNYKEMKEKCKKDEQEYYAQYPKTPGNSLE